MRRLAAISIVIVFGTGVLSFAYDEPFQPEEVKLILLNALVPPPATLDSVFVEGESAIKFAFLDTTLVAVVGWRFDCNSRKIFSLDSVWVKSLSLFSAKDGRWIPIERTDLVSGRSLREIAGVILYPFFLARKKFRGYSFKVQKKKTEIGKEECYKITVRPIKEDNDEESPFYGYIYIADEDNPFPVRFEHHRKSTTGISVIRWDFEKIEGLDSYFPTKILVKMENEMCNYEFGAQINLRFGKCEVKEKLNSERGETGGTER